MFDGIFPALLHFPDGAGTGLVVRFLAVASFLIVNLLFSAPGRGVVGIESENLLVLLERKIEAAAVVIAVRINQELAHFLDFSDELRAHRFVDPPRFLQACQE